MAIASGARHNASYVEETLYGVAPPEPEFTPLRLRGGMSLGLTKESFQSEERDSTRQVKDLRHGTQQVAGGIPVELSHESFDDFIEAALCGEWDGDELMVGNIRRSFMVQSHFADINQYLRYTGVEINGFSFTVNPSGIVQGDFTVIGQGMETPSATPIAGATYKPVVTSSPYDGFGGSILESGAPISVVTEIQLTLENGMSPNFVIGSNKSLQPSIDQFTLTGTLTAFFENAALYNKFLQEAETTLSFTLSDGISGQGMRFLLPRVKFSGGQPDVGTGSVTMPLTFTALYDAVNASTLVVTRGV